MKKLLMVAFVLVLASVAFAAQCVDTDGGGKNGEESALKSQGQAKVGITPHEDICLTSEEGVSINESKYVKEYYCGADDQVYSKVWDCTREGFSGCRNGACYGSTSGSSNSSSSSSSSSSNQNTCGNKILEKAKGEQCDPPDSICFGKTKAQYGICSKACQCLISASAEPVQAVCGDGELDSAKEDCEKDSDCGAGFVCSSCSCVKQLTKEEIEAMKKGEKPSTVDKTPGEDSKDVETSGTGVIDTTPKNFSDSGALKTASSVSNFFKAIFGWIGALFS